MRIGVVARLMTVKITVLGLVMMVRIVVVVRLMVVVMSALGRCDAP